MVYFLNVLQLWWIFLPFAGGGGTLAALLALLLTPQARADVPAECDINLLGDITTLAQTQDSSSPCYGKLIVSQEDFDAVGSSTAAQVSGGTVGESGGSGSGTFAIEHEGVTYEASQWYTGNITNMRYYFYGVTDLSFVGDISGWDTSKVESMASMFRNSGNLTSDIGGWDVSSVENMGSTFTNSDFNQSLSSWDTSSVTNMGYMFDRAAAFNSDLITSTGGWNTSNVTNMKYMFWNATSFNRDISSWDTAQVQDMEGMFLDAGSFDQNISGWNVGLISSEPENFAEGTNENWTSDEQPQWSTDGAINHPQVLDVSPATGAEGVAPKPDLSLTFNEAVQSGNGSLVLYEEFGTEIERFDVSQASDVLFDGTKVTFTPSSNLAYATSYYVLIDEGAILDTDDPGNAYAGIEDSRTWTFTTRGECVVDADSPVLFLGPTDDPTSDCYNQLVVTQAAFDAVGSSTAAQVSGGTVGESGGSGSGAFAIEHEGVTYEASQWYTGNITNMRYYFYGVTDLSFVGDISGWDTSKVESMASMFRNSGNLTSDIGDWDVSSVENMGSTFTNSDFNQSLSNWNTSSVTNMGYMFDRAAAFNSDLITSTGGWNTSNVTNMKYMFWNATSFNRDISSWDTAQVQDMEGMFLDAGSFDQNISGWNVGLISSEPENFAEGTNENWTSDEQPQWNTDGAINHPQVLDVSPATGAEGVAPKPDLSLTFNEAVQSGNGSLVLYEEFGTEIERFDVSQASDVLFDGTKVTFTPSSNLAYATSYYVLIDEGAILDTDDPGNAYAGIEDSRTWTFTTRGECVVDADSPVLFLGPTDDPTSDCYNQLVVTQAAFDAVGSSTAAQVSGGTVGESGGSGSGTFAIEHEGVTYEASQWYTGNITNMRYYFYGVTDLSFVGDISGWDTSKVESMASMFRNSGNLTSDIGDWDVSSVENMGSTFTNSDFNQSLSSWDTSSVTNMGYMFDRAAAFNSDLITSSGGWNTSNVTNMKRMFKNAESFNRDISSWDTAQVQDMEGMFLDAGSFDQNISGWNVGLISSEPENFAEGTNENWTSDEQPQWNTDGATSNPQLLQVFPADQAVRVDLRPELVLTFNEDVQAGDGSIVLYDDLNTQIDSFDVTDTSQVEFTGSEVSFVPSTDLAEFTNFYVLVPSTAVADMSGNTYAGIQSSRTWTFRTRGKDECEVDSDNLVLFLGPTDDPTSDCYNQLVVTQAAFDAVGSSTAAQVSGGTVGESGGSGSGAFAIEHEGVTYEASQWYTGNITNMRYYFYGVTDLSFVGDISGWDTSKVESMASMFRNSGNLTSDIGGWDVSSVENMGSTFTNSDFNQSLSSWDTSSVANMGYMFDRAAVFNSDLITSAGGWNTSNVTNMKYMFWNATSFNRDISSWDTTQVQDMEGMFLDAGSFDQNISGWNVGLISSEPENFAEGTNENWTSDEQPIWGQDATNNPLIVNLSPLDDATDVAVIDTSFVVTFDRNVSVGSGNIRFYNSNDELMNDFAVTDADQVRFSERTVTISPLSSLIGGTNYYVEIGDDAIKSASGDETFAGISDAQTWNFTTAADTSAPRELSRSPEGNGLGLDTNLVLTFDEAVARGDGAILLYTSSGDLVEQFGPESSAVTLSDATVTIDPTLSLIQDTGYYVVVEEDALRDTATAPNSFSGIGANDWTFTTGIDAVAPTVLTYFPAQDATEVEVLTQLQLTFDEEVQKGALGQKISLIDETLATIQQFDAGEADENFVVAGKTVTLRLDKSLTEHRKYHVTIDSGAIQDLAGLAFGGISESTTWSFTTGTDTSPPEWQTVSPNQDGEPAGLSSDLIITFNEPVQWGTAQMHLFLTAQAADGPVESFASGSGHVDIIGNTVTLDPSLNLNADSDYYVVIEAGALTDTADAKTAFGGLAAPDADPDAWTFATGDDSVRPQLQSSSPAVGATGVEVDTDISLTFDESVVLLDGGNFVLYQGSVEVARFDLPSERVSVAGDTVTIDLIDSLAGMQTYNLRISDTALTDASGNGYLGLLDDSFAFETAADAIAPALLGVSPQDDEAGVETDLTLAFNEQVQWDRAGGSIDLYASDGSLIQSFSETNNASAVAFGDQTVTISPSVPLHASSGFYVVVAATALADTSQNAFGGITAPSDGGTSWSFQTRAVSLSDSFLVVSRTTQVANGTDSIDVTVTLEDTNGDPAPGQAVLILRGEDGTVPVDSVSVVDAGNGTYTARLTSTQAGQEIIAARVDGDDLTSGTKTVTFLADSDNLDLQASTIEMADGINSATANGSDSLTVHVTVVDAGGNGVASRDVRIFRDGVEEGRASEEENGLYSLEFRSTVAGTEQISAQVDGQDVLTSDGSASQTVAVTFEADTTNIDLLQSTIEASDTLVVVGDEDGDGATVTVTVRDGNANGVSGQAIVILVDDAAHQGAITDQGDGRYSATLTATHAGTRVIKATVNDDYILTATGTATQTLDLTFAPGSISLATTTVLASPDQVATEGADDPHALITVRARDQYGNNLTQGGEAVTISTTFGTVSGATDQGDGSYALTDNSDGTYTAELRSNNAGDALITARVGGQALTSANATETVTFLEGAPDANQSSFTLSANQIVADGTSTAEIRIEVKDSAGNAVTSGNDLVVVSTNLGTINDASDNGDGTYRLAHAGGGIYTATLTSGTQTGTATITANLNNAPLSADNPEVEFVAGAADAGASTLMAAADTIVADGKATLALTVQAKDAYGNNLSQGGDTVTVATDLGSIEGDVQDQGDGTYTATLRAGNTAGTATVTATLGGEALVDTAVVAFTGDATSINFADSTLDVNTARPAVGEGADDGVTVTVALRDTNGNPVGSQTVDILTDFGVSFVAVEDTSGTYKAQVTSPDARQATISASVGGQALDDVATVVFTGDASAVDTAAASFAVTSASALADGTSSVDLTVTVVDGSGQGVVEQTVEIVVQAGSAVVGPVQDQLDGTYVAALTSSVAGTVTLGARVNGEELDTTVEVTFTGDEDNVDLADARIELLSTSGQALADDTEEIEVKVTVLDRDGKGVSGQTVSIESSLDGVTRGPTEDKLDGTYVIALTSSVVGEATLSARVQGSLIDQTLAVVFTGDEGAIDRDASALTLTSASAQASADGEEAIEVTVTILDDAGRGVSGQTVGLTSAPLSLVIGAVEDRLDGTYVADVRSNNVGETTLTASVNGQSLTSGGVVVTFTEPVDDTPPQIAGLSPSAGQQDVAIDTALTVTFDEDVLPGSGQIVLYTGDHDQVQAFTVPSSEVVFGNRTVTFAPANALANSSEFYVKITAGTVTDAADALNPFGGIDDAETWAFTTAALDLAAPQIVNLSPAAGASNVAIDTALAITFDEDVAAGDGTFTLYALPDNAVVERLDVASNAVTISANRVTISPSAPLPVSTDFYLLISDGALVDTAPTPNAFAGITDSSTWAFTTEAEGEFSAEQVSLIETSLLVADTMAAQPLNAAAYSLSQSAPGGGGLDGKYPPHENIYIGQLHILSGREGSGGFSLVDWFTYGIADADLDAELSGDGLLGYATFGTELRKTQDEVAGLIYGIEVSEWTYEDEPDVDRTGLSFGYYQGKSFDDLIATGSAILTVSNNEFLDEQDATGDALSTRLLLNGELRGKQQYEDGSSLVPFANLFYAIESMDDFQYSNGSWVDAATVTVGRYSLGVEYQSKAHTQGRYVIRGSLGQTFGAEEITLSDGTVYTPNEDVTGTVTFGWHPPPQGDSRTSIELTIEGLGDSDSEVIRLDGNWDRAY